MGHPTSVRGAPSDERESGMGMSWLVTCTALVVLDGLLLSFVPGGDARIAPLGGLFALLPYEAVSTAMISAFVLTVFRLGVSALRWFRLLRQEQVCLRRLIAVVLPVSGLTAFFVASWGVRYQTGSFPDRGTWGFVIVSAQQLWEHARHQSPALLAMVLVGISLMGPLLAGLVVWLSVWSRELADRGATRVMTALLAVFVLWAVRVELGPGRSESSVKDPRSGAELSQAQLFDSARQFEAGPFASLLAQLPSARPRLALSESPEAIRFERRPQIGMHEYFEDAGRPDPAWNVIIVLVESLRPDELRALGSPRVVVPHIDALAREGILFERAYTQASHSDAADPCPLSSQGPIRGPYGSAAYSRDPPYPRVLIYDVLQAAGYRTALISSQNETWGGMLHFLDTGGLDRIFHSETFDGETYVPVGDASLARFVRGGKRAGKIDDRHTVDELLSFIDSRPRERPFFAYVNLQNSHYPYEVPADFPLHFSRPFDRLEGSMAVFSAQETVVARRRYRDALRYVDHQFGRLVAHLRERGELERTVLVVTGDTGQAFMEHGFATHAQDLYDEVMRVPLVVRAPGTPPRREAAIAQHIDVPPTILGLLGVKSHPAFHGVDLFKAPLEQPRPIFLSVRTLRHQLGVVFADYKMIHDFRLDRTLLYDLRSDPGERHEISRLLPELSAALRDLALAQQRVTISYYADRERMATEYPPRIDPESITEHPLLGRVWRDRKR